MELDDLLSRKVSSNDQATNSTEAETAFTNALYSELTRNFQSETVNEEEDELTKSLLRAVTSQNSNRAEAVKEILEKGADPNKRYGGKKRTAMHEVLRRYQPDSPVDDENVAEDLQGESLECRSMLTFGESHVILFRSHAVAPLVRR